MKILGIHGTSFSPCRALGIDVLKRNIAKVNGIPLTKQGLERKIGRTRQHIWASLKTVKG